MTDCGNSCPSKQSRPEFRLQQDADFFRNVRHKAFSQLLQKRIEGQTDNEVYLMPLTPNELAHRTRSSIPKQIVVPFYSHSSIE